MKGYIFKLSGGALVFNLEDVNFNEWTREINIEPVTLANAPYVTVSYGDESRVVRELYAYFNLESSLFNYTVQNKFGCELKGAIQQFQTENGLTVTGDYDNATMKFATSLKKNIYVFKDQFGVKQFVGQCQIANRQVIDVVTNIKVPEGGFKFKETADNNEFYKVQAAMIKFLNDAFVSLPTNTNNKKTNTNNKKMKDALSLLETALTNQDNRGDYGEATQAVVGICKNILINGLKISLTNTTNNFVDQQFVDELTKKRQL
jgi:peptidoglycan hydrolase-like protein with peptidoglycan-binding domain